MVVEKSTSFEEEIIEKILAETIAYRDAIKNNKPFEEAKTIRLRIKELIAELKLVLADK